MMITNKIHKLVEYNFTKTDFEYGRKKKNY